MPTTRCIVAILCVAGCGPRLTTIEHPSPFHQAVGCWRITPAETNTYVLERLLPGPVFVRTIPHAIHFFDISSDSGRTLGYANFRLDLLSGLEGEFLTSWIPLNRDTVSLEWSRPGPYGLVITAEVRGDSLHGSGGELTDTGGTGLRVGIVGVRVRC